MKTINIMKSITILLTTLLLVGCNGYDEMKTFLQTEYDKINPKGDEATCFYVGNLTYPYINEPFTYYRQDGWNKTITRQLNERLPAFVQVGLLQEIESGIGQDGKSYPQYDLTELGKQYVRSYTQPGKGPSDENFFCFGRLVIIEITEMEDKESDLFVAKTIETKVNFTYRLENTPEWAENPAMSMYGYKDYLDPEWLYTGQVWLTKKDGQYYNFSSGNSIDTYVVKGD